VFFFFFVLVVLYKTKQKKTKKERAIFFSITQEGMCSNCTTNVQFLYKAYIVCFREEKKKKKENKNQT
jgi:hypothetical protein